MTAGADEPTRGAADGSLARIHSIQVSDGGVPKVAVATTAVTASGLQGDRQRDLRHHGGPDRAVCLLGLDVIQALADEGHPIAPGRAGENLTLEGIPWASLGVGSRLAFDGGVELLVTGFAQPCQNIAGCFVDGDFSRMAHQQHPGRGRLYARVIRPGQVSAGDGVRVLDDGAASA